MKIIDLLRRPALLRLNLPVATLVALLQRSPIARLATAAGDFFGGQGGGYVLKSSVAAVAALGAVDTLAGATTYTLQATQGSPLTVPLNQSMQAVGFTVTNTINIGSWNIVGPIPPGLAFSAVEGGNSVSGNGGMLDATTTGQDDGYGGMTGGNSQTTPLLKGTPTTAGTYSIKLTAYEFGGGGGLVSPTYTFTINVSAPAALASFTTNPSSQTVTAGANVTFTVAVSDPAATIQWTKNGNPIGGATSTTLTLTNVTAADGGSYAAIATNAAGPATSQAATLAVSAAPSKPAFTSQPASQTVLTGGTVVFNAAATGATSYQWSLNGAPLPGATSARLLIANAQSANNGTYAVTATNGAGSVTSANATLTTTASNDFGRLINLSVLTNAGSGSNLLTVGFTTGGGTGSASEPVLIRATGPALSALGVPGAVLPDPTLTVINQGSKATVASNDNWSSTTANMNAVNTADAQTGGFPLTVGSLDAALTATLSSGGYSVQVSGNGSASGQALAEVYDNTPGGTFTPATPRLTNLSCLSNVSGSGTLIAGFTVAGSTSRTVLVRATGPALAALGLGGTMADPQVVLASTANGAVIASNAGWGGDPQITQVDNAVLAFALPAGSKDSVVVATLPPGGYSATASSVSGSGGATLIEVYEVP